MSGHIYINRFNIKILLSYLKLLMGKGLIEKSSNFVFYSYVSEEKEFTNISIKLLFLKIFETQA
jgi:hypothetical protein